MSIPKIIHYCWFGGKPKPELAERCIRSWKKYCQGYELREWNEDTFDLTAAPLYVQQAMAARRWAFVTDYVRLKALVEEGGVYMDTDVEVIRPLDRYLSHRAFAGFENPARVQTGLLACEPGFPLFQAFLDHYDTATFYKADGTLDVTTNVEVLTRLCLDRGMVPNNQLQTVEGLTLYPMEYFCPVDYDTMKLKKTRKTAVIHWFSGSWHSEEELKALEAERRRQKEEARSNFRYGLGCALFGEKGYETLKSIIKRG